MEEPKYTIDLRTNNGWWARLQSWFVGGRLVTPNQGSQTGPVSAHGHLGDSSINDERILQISTVWRCVSLISTLTACLPLDVFETDQNDNRKKVDLSNPLARLLRYSPNQYMTAQEFREAMTMQLCFYGNAYALVDRNSAGDVISLLPLQSANMDVKLVGKKVVYRYQRDSEYADFSQKEIFHLKGFGFTGLVGLSPIAFACKSAGVAVAMEDQQRDFFANGAKSPQILSTGEKVLTEQQRSQVEENFKEIAGGPVKKRLWIPGIIMPGLRRLTIRDLLAQGRTSSNALEYVREEVFTNNADVVAEKALKPESDITFSKQTANVKTIAHWVQASRQVMDDAPMLQSYINNRLMYGLALKEEGQLLNGDGTGDNLEGLNKVATAYDTSLNATGDIATGAVKPNQRRAPDGTRTIQAPGKNSHLHDFARSIWSAG
ncbi:TPA: phage portal protein [Escherichia coli]